MRYLAQELKECWLEILIALVIFVAFVFFVKAFISVLFEEPKCFNHTIWVGNSGLSSHETDSYTDDGRYLHYETDHGGKKVPLTSVIQIDNHICPKGDKS